MRDKISSLILLFFGIFIFWVSRKLPQPVYESLGSGFFPKILACSLIGLSVILLAQAFINKESAATAKAISCCRENIFSPETIRLIVCFGMTLAYVIVLKYVGFTISTIVFLILMMGYLSHMNRKNLFWTLVAAVGYVLAVNFIFEKLLKIFLP